MKKITFLIISFVLVQASVLYSQENLYDRIKQEYELFEYAKVIEHSNNFITQGGISDTLMIDVYLMRAVSFYSLGKEDSTRNNFLEILKINSNYNADPARISPKLITIFNSVKSDFLKTHTDPATKTDSTQQQKYLAGIINPTYKYALLQNFLVPGWGHINNGNLTKGITLAAVSTANLAVMIYYINDTNKKENEYLSETNKSLFQQKYDSFNSSYKTRNILIASYVIIWLYSQLDFLFISDDNQSDNNILSSNRIYIESNRDQLNIGYKLPLHIFGIE